MIRNRSLNFVAYVGCILLAASCQSSRTTGSTIPPAPSGPIQTASNDGSVVPAGAVLAIQTDEPIDTETAGEVYSAEVSREVISKDYDVVIPRGSSAELVVVRADRGGTTGTPEIVLALQSLTVKWAKVYR